jgi:hypothetical protein
MFNGGDEDQSKYWDDVFNDNEEYIKENYKLKDDLATLKGMVKILSQEIVTKDYLLTHAVERLEVINYEDDHLTNDLIQTIKKALT